MRTRILTAAFAATGLTLAFTFQAHANPLQPFAQACFVEAEIVSALGDRSGMLARGTTHCLGAGGQQVAENEVKIGLILPLGVNENLIGTKISLVKGDLSTPFAVEYTLNKSNLGYIGNPLNDPEAKPLEVTLLSETPIENATLVVNAVVDSADESAVMEVRAVRGGGGYRGGAAVRGGAYRGGAVAYRGGAYRSGAYVRRGVAVGVGAAAVGAAAAAPYYYGGGCDPNYQDCGYYGGGAYYGGGYYGRGAAVVGGAAVVRRGGAYVSHHRGGAYRGGGAHVAHRGGGGRRR